MAGKDDKPPFELTMEEDGQPEFLLPDPVRSQAAAVASMAESRGLHQNDALFTELASFIRMLAALEKEEPTP